MISKKSAALGAVAVIIVTAFYGILTVQVGTYIDIRNGDR